MAWPSRGFSIDCATASLMRAMLTMHSRSTASVTWRNSISSGPRAWPAPSAVRARHDHADQLLIEAVFDLDQRRSHAQQRALARGRALGDDRLQVARLALHFVAQLAEAEHAERVADLLQQLQLRRQLVDLRAALAHEDVQRILHAAEVFLDRGGHGLHELDRRRRQAFARLLDVIVDRQQLGQAERGAHRGDARPGAARTRHVVKQIVQQLERRRFGVAPSPCSYRRLISRSAWPSRRLIEALPSRPPSRSASSTAPTTHHSWNTGCVVATCSSFSAERDRISRFCSTRSPLIQPSRPSW